VPTNRISALFTASSIGGGIMQSATTGGESRSTTGRARLAAMEATLIGGVTLEWRFGFR
jgi:hypothetical protein